VKVGVAQIACRSGDAAGNMAGLRTWARAARERGCELVVFPELADTGYDMDAVRRLRAQERDDPLASLGAAAAECGLHIVCGVAERTNQGLFNSAAVLAPDGRCAAVYRKTHLLSTELVREESVFTPGDRLVTARIGGWVVGLLVCYDLRFPEAARALAVAGAEILIVVSAWPEVRAEHWDIFTRSRAIENQAWLLASNRTGTDGPIAFCGRSRIVDPWGSIASSAGAGEEALICAELDRGRLDSVRAALPVFRQRRVDLYGVDPQH
jgi:predicted amidohydrolase